MNKKQYLAKELTRDTITFGKVDGRRIELYVDEDEGLLLNGVNWRTLLQLKGNETLAGAACNTNEICLLAGLPDEACVRIQKIYDKFWDELNAYRTSTANTAMLDICKIIEDTFDMEAAETFKRQAIEREMKTEKATAEKELIRLKREVARVETYLKDLEPGRSADPNVGVTRLEKKPDEDETKA